MYQKLTQITTDIPAKIAESLSACGRTYWYARALDKSGKGWANIYTAQIAYLLGVDRSTISRYVKQCLRLGIFTSVQRFVGGYRVHYKALGKVTHDRGFDSYGPFARVAVEDLSKLKYICAEVVAQSLQAQSHYLAQIEKRKQLEQKRYQGESEADLFGTALRYPRRENVIWMSKRYVFVNGKFMAHGASLDAIAKASGRHRSTVQRMLDNRYREDRGIAPIVKKQLAVQVDASDYAWMKMNAQKHLFEDLEPGLSRTFECNGSHWRTGCTLYSLGHELVSKQHQKAELSRMCKEGNNKYQNCTK